MSEQAIFTAREVQAALTAVILFERDRAERQLRLMVAVIEEAIRSNTRQMP